MASIKCISCGLVNFATASSCKRCGNEISIGLSQSNKPSIKIDKGNSPVRANTRHRFLLPSYSLNGCGILMYGHKQLSSDTFEVTRWITLCTIPLIPLSTWEILPLRTDDGLLPLSTKYTFEIIDHRPLNIEHILRVYGVTLVAMLPILILVKLKNGKPANIFDIIQFFLTAGWGFAISVIAHRKHEKMFAPEELTTAQMPIPSRQPANKSIRLSIFSIFCKDITGIGVLGFMAFLWIGLLLVHFGILEFGLVKASNSVIISYCLLAFTLVVIPASIYRMKRIQKIFERGVVVTGIITYINLSPSAPAYMKPRIPDVHIAYEYLGKRYTIETSYAEKKGDNILDSPA